MHEKAEFVFFTTLILYLITLFTVSYVGVYLTYIAIPIIVLSGLVMIVTKPPREIKSNNDIEKFLEENIDSKKIFQEKILQKINLIYKNDIIKDYYFFDQNGKHYSIDFLIKNNLKNYFLLIEIDSYKKIKKSYGDTSSFIERQSVLLEQFGFILRYDINSIMNQPNIIIAEITQILTLQSKGKFPSAINAQTYEKKIQEKNQEIDKLKQNQQVVLLKNKEELLSLKKKIIKYEYEKSLHNKEIDFYTKEIKNFRENKTEQSSIQSIKPKTFKSYFLENKFIILFLFITTGLILYQLNKSTSSQLLEQESFFTESDYPDIDVSDPKEENIPVLIAVTKENNNDLNKINMKESLFINSSDAKYYIGQYQTVCGQISQLKTFSKGIYINFDQPYPNQTFSAIIWNNYQNLIEHALKWDKKQICIVGKITQYRGKPQIELHDIEQVIYN